MTTPAEKAADRPIPHGGAGTSYEYHGCRCDECTQAHRRRIARRRDERRTQVQKSGLPEGVEHGKSAYSNWGCRCDVCTEANTAACREYAARTRATSPEMGAGS